MKRVIVTAALSALLHAGRARSALVVGAQAPALPVPGTQDGVPPVVDLPALLSKGPAILFFLPIAFNGDSMTEARAFADEVARFRAAGATVTGMSRDPADAIGRFPKEERDGRFPTASAEPALVTGFAVNDNANFTTHTTYVIASRQDRLRARRRP